jgi:hypothetical protein
LRSFTAVVTNNAPQDPAPTGTVTFEDVFFNGSGTVTNVLAQDIVLSNGIVQVVTSSLSAGVKDLGNHFIAARYNGDTNYAKGSSTCSADGS